MNWIKTHRLHTLALCGVAFILTGVILMLPRSPWTLVAIGCALLFVALILVMPQDESPK